MHLDLNRRDRRWFSGAFFLSSRSESNELSLTSFASPHTRLRKIKRSDIRGHLRRRLRLPTTMRGVTPTDCSVAFASFRRALLSTKAATLPRVSAATTRSAHSSSSSSGGDIDAYDVDSVLELTCHAIASDGSGVCKLPNGVICLVTGATPDEKKKVLVKLTQVKKTVAFGVKLFEDDEETSTPSTYHQKPFCAHHATCGGCSWQDVKYERQLELKRTMVVESFAKNGKLGADAAEALVGKTVGLRTASEGDAPTKFRNKMTFAFGVDNSAEKGGAKIGLRPPKSHDVVVDVTSPSGCLLQSDSANEALRAISKSLRKAGKSLPPFDRKTGSGTLRSATFRENSNGKIDVEIESTSRESAVKTGPLKELMLETLAVPNVKSVTHVQIDRVANLKQAGRGRKQSNVKSGKRPESNRKAKTTMIDDEEFDDAESIVDDAWEVSLSGLKFRARPESFFQTNSTQAEVLVNAAVEALKPLFEEKPTKQKKMVLDLFSGVGVFGLTVAAKIPNISKVIGYEIVKEAVQDANENAILNNLSNRCEFYVRDLTKPGPLEGFDVDDDDDDDEEENADCLVEAVIVDPARPGCSKDILSEIRKLRPKRIVYVSCNPDTQARDANILFGNEDEADDIDETKKHAKYALLSVTPCDMFPHALHVETVAVFDRVQ